MLAAGDEVAETEHVDNIYSMASGNAETVETMNDFGAGSRPMSLAAGKDVTYDLAWMQAGGDPVYDMGGGLEHLAAGIKDIEHAGATCSTGTEHPLFNSGLTEPFMDRAGTLVAVVGLGKGGRVAAPVPWLAVGRWGGLSEALSAMGGARVLLITKGRGSRVFFEVGVDDGGCGRCGRASKGVEEEYGRGWVGVV